MYTPAYRCKRNGIPILSKQEIDNIGEQLVGDFCPEAIKTPIAVDIDGFAQNYLGLIQDFQYLSHNGIYLGMMVFNDTDSVIVYDPCANRAEYISEKARTVIIDSRLLEENQEHRYRFTMGHESAHDIIHKGYYSHKPDQRNNIPLIQCRIDSSSLSRKRISRWTDNDWMEWQANRLSSAILMPASMVRKLISNQKSNKEQAFKAACCVYAVFRTFNVSVQAAEIRLRDLGIINGIPKQAIMDGYPFSLDNYPNQRVISRYFFN